MNTKQRKMNVEYYFCSRFKNISMIICQIFCLPAVGWVWCAVEGAGWTCCAWGSRTDSAPTSQTPNKCDPCVGSIHMNAQSCIRLRSLHSAGSGFPPDEDERGTVTVGSFMFNNENRIMLQFGHLTKNTNGTDEAIWVKKLNLTLGYVSVFEE